MVTFIVTVTCVDKNDPDVKVEKDDFGVKKKKKRAHFHSKALLTTNRLGLKQIVNLTIQQIIKKDWISEGPGWRIESVDNHRFNIVEYFPLSGRSSIKLPPELKNLAKGLFNLKNNDNECFRLCHIRYLNPQ